MHYLYLLILALLLFYHDMQATLKSMVVFQQFTTGQVLYTLLQMVIIRQHGMSLFFVEDNILNRFADYDVMNADDSAC